MPYRKERRGCHRYGEGIADRSKGTGVSSDEGERRLIRIGKAVEGDIGRRRGPGMIASGRRAPCGHVMLAVGLLEPMPPPRAIQAFSQVKGMIGHASVRFRFPGLVGERRLLDVADG